MKGELDLKLSARALDAIRQFMAHAPRGHVLSLLKAGSPEDIDAEWTVGFYSSEQIDTAEKRFEGVGVAIRYEVAGIEFVIEPHFAKLLKGKIVDFHKGNFRVTERKNGI